MSDTDWQVDALCAQTDPETFHPAAGEWTTTRRAKAVCRVCPAVDACLAYALADRELDGVWGGTTKPERQRMRRAAGIESAAAIDAVAIDRAMAGLPVQLTTVERAEIVRRLANLRYNDAEIAARIGVSSRHVLRIRTANNIESRWAA